MKSPVLLFLAVVLPGLVAAQEFLTKEEFKEKVWDFELKGNEMQMKSDLPVVLDFYATWCGPCKLLEPELSRLQQEYEGKLNVYKIDVDAERELASFFGISAMPTMFFIRTDGSYTYILGYRTFDELKQMVDTFLFSTQRSLVSFMSEE